MEQKQHGMAHIYHIRQGGLGRAGRQDPHRRLRHRPATGRTNLLQRRRHSLKALFHPLVRDRHRERGHKKTALPVLRHGIIRYLCGHIDRRASNVLHIQGPSGEPRGGRPRQHRGAAEP